MPDIVRIIWTIDKHLEQECQATINPVEANKILEKAGLLKDSKDRPGKPLRDLLRKGHLAHAYKLCGRWIIPQSPRKTKVN